MGHRLNAVGQPGIQRAAASAAAAAVVAAAAADSAIL